MTNQDIQALLTLKELHELRKWLQSEPGYLNEQGRRTAIGIVAETVLRQIESVNYKMMRLRD